MRRHFSFSLLFLAFALGAPAAASAQAPALPVPVPCVETGLLPPVGGCPTPDPKPQPKPDPAPTAPKSGCARADEVPTAATISAARKATLCLLNKERAKRKLGRLRANTTLLSAAQRYSDAMVRHDFFAHVSPVDGSTLVSRVKKTPYLRGAGGWSLGENLAWGSGRLATPQEIVRSWMQSPAHKRNVLTGAFKEVGIGITPGAPVGADAANAATYTTDFGRRA